MRRPFEPQALVDLGEEQGITFHLVVFRPLGGDDCVPLRIVGPIGGSSAVSCDVSVDHREMSANSPTDLPTGLSRYDSSRYLLTFFAAQQGTSSQPVLHSAMDQQLSHADALTP